MTDDDELAVEIKQNPMLGKLLSVAVVIGAAKIAGACGVKLTIEDNATVIAVGMLALNSVSWYVAHALNSVLQLRIMPVYWRAFPKIPPDPPAKG